MSNETKTIYRIWDAIEKTFVGNNWTTREAANEQKAALLREWPHGVYLIREFKSQRHAS